jgi:hypothetical protein
VDGPFLEHRHDDTRSAFFFYSSSMHFAAAAAAAAAAATRRHKISYQVLGGHKDIALWSVAVATGAHDENELIRLNV